MEEEGLIVKGWGDLWKGFLTVNAILQLQLKKGNMKDKEPVQRELALRASDKLPFTDTRAIRGVVREFMDNMNRIRDKSGNIVFPYSLSRQEEKGVRRFLRKHHFGLAARIDAFCPVRLKEGMGTEILIREKEGGG